MVVYISNFQSIFLLKYLIFRGGFNRSLKNLIKILFAKKKIKKTTFKYAAFLHKRKQENRVYGIVKQENKSSFFKINENDFNQLFINFENNLNDILNVSEPLISKEYKHRILTRIEFEQLGYGLEDKLYHGDVSKGNILANKSKVILIDDEFKDFYSDLYQNLDYLINLFEKHNFNKKQFFDFNWLFSVIQMYRETSQTEFIDTLKKRMDNGCDFATKILSNRNSTK